MLLCELESCPRWFYATLPSVGPSTSPRLTVKCVGVPPYCTLRHMCSVCIWKSDLFQWRYNQSHSESPDCWLLYQFHNHCSFKRSCHLYRNRPNSLIFFPKMSWIVYQFIFPDKLACSCGIEMSRGWFLIAQWNLAQVIGILSKKIIIVKQNTKERKI